MGFWRRLFGPSAEWDDFAHPPPIRAEQSAAVNRPDAYDDYAAEHPSDLYEALSVPCSDPAHHPGSLAHRVGEGRERGVGESPIPTHLRPPPADLQPRRPIGYGGGEELLELVERQHVAIEFLRLCEAEGDKGADHPCVLEALRGYEAMRVRGSALWCPVCHTFHVDPGVKTDAGEIVRPCPRA